MNAPCELTDQLESPLYPKVSSLYVISQAECIQKMLEIISGTHTRSHRVLGVVLPLIPKIYQTYHISVHESFQSSLSGS